MACPVYRTPDGLVLVKARTPQDLKPELRYRMRVSPRGRTVRLRVTYHRGLEVVVPRGYDPAQIPTLLEKKKAWIRRAVDRAESLRMSLEPESPWRLPGWIALAATNTTWQITARKTEGRRVTIHALAANHLLLVGDIDSSRACKEALGRWLIKQGRQHLVRRLGAISSRTGLLYRSVLVKRQRTRWASCSARGTISLNATLLFLPPEVVNYVLTHELCHLEELNHSRRFWDLVGTHYADTRWAVAQLREMWRMVPHWALG